MKIIRTCKKETRINGQPVRAGQRTLFSGRAASIQLARLGRGPIAGRSAARHLLQTGPIETASFSYELADAAPAVS